MAQLFACLILAALPLAGALPVRRAAQQAAALQRWLEQERAGNP